MKNKSLKNFRYIMAIMFVAMLSFCVSLLDGGKTLVFAKVNGDNTIDFGNVCNYTDQNGEIPVYNEIKEYNLFVDSDENLSKEMYTTKFINLAGADPMKGTSSLGGAKFEFVDNTLKLSAIDSTKTSSRNPYAAHSFKIPENFVNAAKNGYLKVSVSGGAQTTDTDDTIYFILYNGTQPENATINSKSGGTNNKSEFVNQEVALSNNITSADFVIVYTVVAGTNRGTLFGKNIAMNISSPKLTISTTDTTSPEATIDVDSSWSNATKTMTIHVKDSQSGIQKVIYNGSELSKTSGSDKDSYYKIDVEDNGEYSFKVIDNVGNSKTYTHSESTIDKVAPVDVQINNFPSADTIYNSEITFDVEDFEHDGLTEEKIYYTLDGSKPTRTSETFTPGSVTLNLIPNKYTLRAMIIDGVDNCGTEFKREFTVARRKINITIANATYTIEKPTTLDTDSGLMCYDGENVKLKFSPSEGYERKKLLVNGMPQQFDSDEVEFEISEDLDIAVYYAFRIEMLSCTTTYTFDPFSEKQNLIYKFNTTEPLEYNISIKNGEVESEPFNAGHYTFTWSYDSDTFIGSGSFEFDILKIDINIDIAEDQYKVYGESDPEIRYSISGLPHGIDMNEVVSREVGESAGSYNITLVSHDLSLVNYNITTSKQVFTIRKKKIVVVANSITKVYGESDEELTYELYNSNMVGEDVLYGNLIRTSGEDVGKYDILLGTLNNDNYEILFMQGQFNIIAKDVDITINPITVTYGDEKSLTYTTSISVDDGQITGSLERKEGNDVGYYEISIGTLTSTNYNLHVVSATVYYQIVPKHITVKANPVTMVYGGDYNLTYTADGLVNDDELLGSLQINTSIRGVLPVDTYEIVSGTLQNPNYIIDYEKNYLTVTPAGLTINILDASQVYGEVEQFLECEILGLVGSDKVEVTLYRENGDDVGDYQINALELHEKNYVVERVNTGTYHIVKATMQLVVPNVHVIYDGTTQYVQLKDFPFELTYNYFKDGIECDGLLSAGEYEVEVKFDGNQNYEPASVRANIVVEKQKVYLTLSDNEFIYDGTVKYPEFYFDTTCGLDVNKISYDFDGGVTPVEVGEYHFTINTFDSNYEVFAEGILKIANSFSVSNENDSIVECVDATFDSTAKDLVMVENSASGRFNNQEILSTCSFENVTENNYVYTIRIKAKAGVNKIYVYQLGENNSVRQMAVSLIDGYYVFKVDSLTDTYLITKDIEPVPLWFWVVVMASVIIALVLVLLIVKYAKRRIRARKSSTSIANYNAD